MTKRSTTPTAGASRPPRKRKRKDYDQAGTEWSAAFRDRLDEVITAAGGVLKCAELLHTSRSAISQYRNGDRIPDGPALRRISERTNYSLNWLLFGDEPKMRDQTRPEADLATELATHVAREVGLEFERRPPFPDERYHDWRADGSKLLELCVTTASALFREHRAWELRVNELRAACFLIAIEDTPLDTMTLAQAVAGLLNNERVPEKDRAVPPTPRTANARAALAHVNRAIASEAPPPLAPIEPMILEPTTVAAKGDLPGLLADIARLAHRETLPLLQPAVTPRRRPARRTRREVGPGVIPI